MKKNIFILSDNLEYPRNRTFFMVFENVFSVKSLIFKKKIRIRNIFKIFKNAKSIFDAELVFCFWPTHKYFFEILILKILNKKIVIDFFVSNYDLLVLDRRILSRYSFKAWYHYLLEYFLIRVAKLIVFDTEANRDFYLKCFRAKSFKSVVLPISIDLNRYQQTALLGNRSEDFHVLFYGKYIPFQGVDLIVRAAKLLEHDKNIRFTLIGSGQTYQENRFLAQELNLKNITWIDHLPYEKLHSYLQGANLCLGVFGKTDKSERVIPNKVLEAMACYKIVLTAKSIELEKWFKDSEDVVLCEQGNPQDIADKIFYVFKNWDRLQSIGSNARMKVEKYFSTDVLVHKIEKEFSLC